MATGEAENVYGVVDMEDVNNREICVLPFHYQDIVLQVSVVARVTNASFSLFHSCLYISPSIVLKAFAYSLLFAWTGGAVYRRARQNK